MADEKKKGYLLKDGSVFVPTANVKITSPDNTNLLFEVDKVVFNFSEYFTPTVGEKLTFANGNYMECTSVWENFGTHYKLTLKQSNGTTIIDKAYELYKTSASMEAYGVKGEVTVYPIGSVEGTIFNIEVPYAMYAQLEEYKASTKNGTIWRAGNEYFYDPAIVHYLGKEVEVYSKYKGATSGEGGYGGSFDNSSDRIELPSLPTLSASSCGFVDLFQLTLSETLALSNYLWSNVTEVYEHLKKLFSNPMDAIISLSLVNVTPLLGNSTDIHLGGLSTGVNGTALISQFVEVDCGTITVPLYWGTALDYSPSAKAELYLPCIGTVPINIDDILGKNMRVVYQCDLLSGASICYVIIDGSVMYQYTGNIVTQIPYSASSNMELYKAVISTVGGVAMMGSGAVKMAGATTKKALSNAKSQIAEGKSDALQGANDIMASKPQIQRGGTISGNTGALCIKKPYLTLVRAVQSLPENYQTFKGFPSNITAKLGDLKGYTEVEYVHLDNIAATDSEKEEILQRLSDGVIL